ncbi:MAG: radical SAM protein [Desulfobulbaceae bacterium]|jgi:histone acetyltransferase (RNA polymerase elongator complex component)|nr:radical SAM protein [Desulfobulbaceae bacterium]
MSLIIPVFIGHRGCPHRCLFCDQKAISGADGRPDVAAEIEKWLALSPKRPAQLAFYGGSFTCLPWPEQQELLAPARFFLRRGDIDSIRLSTRPDCCGEERLVRLRRYGVTTIEIGVQSLDERTLARAQRGHTAADSRQAIATVKRLGLACGVQLLPGLPEETWPSFLAGIQEIIALRPDFVRLYPALVVAGTGLAALHTAGLYRPLSLARAIAWLTKSTPIFSAAHIPVIRYGLPPSPELERALVAGPYHPALGELVAQRLWFLELRRRLSTLRPGQILTIFVSGRDLSALIGQRRGNLIRLEQLGLRQRLNIVIEPHRAKGSVDYALDSWS